MNVFRKGDDFVIITELPGVKKSDIEVQVKGRTLRLSGTKTVAFPEKAAVIGASGSRAHSTGRCHAGRDQSRRRQL